MIDGFEHAGDVHKCSICTCEYSEEEGGIEGHFGILPVAFCPTCFSSLCDMVNQYNDGDFDIDLEDEAEED
jgi:hypothetical protein